MKVVDPNTILGTVILYARKENRTRTSYPASVPSGFITNLKKTSFS
jgi:hypothetical protein